MEKKKNLLNLKKKFILLSMALGIGAAPLSNINAYAVDTKTTQTSEEDNEMTYPELVTYYSKMFGIKEEIIYDTIDYKTSGLFESVDNNELTILETTRELYDSPEMYGYDRDSISFNCDYEMKMEIEEAVEKYANLYGVNKEVALAIVYCECGSDVDSANYLENNNPAGIGPFNYYRNKEVGVIEFMKLLKDDCNCKEDSGEGFLNAIASSYSGGTGEHWLSLTVPFYYYLCDDYYYKKPELKEKHNKKDDKSYKLR